MKFFVIGRASGSDAHHDDRIAMLVATQRQLAELPQVESVLSFAGERAFGLVVNATTATELDHIVFGLAGESLIEFDVHVVVD
jgi:hypothetical protein